MHLDGYFHSILKYLKEMPFDGIEALTPTPQGDVTLEEIKEHIGDKVLLDGIPAIYFMAPYPRRSDGMHREVHQAVRAAPGAGGVRRGAGGRAERGGDPRIKMVAEYCKNLTL